MKNNKNEINIEDFGFIKYGEFYHDVHIHLVNGEILTTLENEDLPENKTIFHEFRNTKNCFLNIVVGIDGFASIPKDKILYITVCNVRKI
ncbi:MULTISPECIES: hypothetical protein [Bacillota]|jgi:hypothetical protein|uniref:Uncharacterized protein n=1 Tax=[Eubacterium] hominis TaxID=2764325 RepID=A0A7G9GIH9_9FIRM|nr:MULTISPECIES: hypothetical protein [Bacillota]MCR0451227.1 hypothetical protein [[Clostridium] innocuum]QNM10611.1 hypothetical protein H9Q80_09910 [[Eubacterium] hominis]MCR0473068.1 hypothetical protein [[Clostridium] innocuum]RGB54049.1 hypothetical protein DW271_11480 [Absiella sp. AM22-9]RGB61153.1 hypothetical protein DW120_06825 [Absiella sp. AM10-20]